MPYFYAAVTAGLDTEIIQRHGGNRLHAATPLPRATLEGVEQGEQQARIAA
jgi:hypothetical protein